MENQQFKEFDIEELEQRLEMASWAQTKCNLAGPGSPECEMLER